MTKLSSSSSWYDNWRQVFDQNQQLLKELSEYPQGYHESLLADLIKRRKFLLLLLREKERGR